MLDCVLVGVLTPWSGLAPSHCHRARLPTCCMKRHIQIGGMEKRLCSGSVVELALGHDHSWRGVAY